MDSEGADGATMITMMQLVPHLLMDRSFALGHPLTPNLAQLELGSHMSHPLLSFEVPQASRTLLLYVSSLSSLFSLSPPPPSHSRLTSCDIIY